MTINNEVYRPLKVAGIFFLIASLVGAVFFNYVHIAEGLEPSFVIFISINIIFHLLLGIGVIMQKMWGLHLLKIYLYILVLGFPIGTYIGVKSLRYIRENKIQDRLKTL